MLCLSRPFFLSSLTFPMRAMFFGIVLRFGGRVKRQPLRWHTIAPSKNSKFLLFPSGLFGVVLCLSSLLLLKMPFFNDSSTFVWVSHVSH